MDGIISFGAVPGKHCGCNLDLLEKVIFCVEGSTETPMLCYFI